MILINTLISGLLCLCGGGATVTSTAERIDPPVPAPVVFEWSTESVNGHCVGFEGLLSLFSPGWNVYRMSGIMYRESRCTPDATNSCCSGLLQMHRQHIPFVGCSVLIRQDFYDPVKNICSAAALWEVQGYAAWSTS